MRAFQSPETAPSALIRPASPWVAVAAAAVVALAGAGLRAALGERIGDHGAFLVFVPAVVVGAALGGWMSGTAAALIGLGAGLLLSPLNPALGLEAALFLGVAAAVTLGGEWFQRAHRDLSARETHLRLILNTIPDAMILIDDAGLIVISPISARADAASSLGRIAVSYPATADVQGDRGAGVGGAPRAVSGLLAGMRHWTRVAAPSSRPPFSPSGTAL